MEEQNITRAYREAAKLYGPADVPTKVHARCLPFKEARKIEGITEADLVTGKKAAVVIIEEGTSLNRVKYRREVLERGVPLFEGAKVFYDHKGSDRSFRDLAGKITGAYYAGQNMVGVLEVIEPDKWLQSVVKNHPELVGLSVYLWCRAKPGEGEDEGLDVIEEIVEVQSVDLVDAPAAGGRVLHVLENQKKDDPAETPTESASESPENPTEQEPALQSDNEHEAAEAAPEEEPQNPEPVTDDVKENEKMEKQIQELEAQLHAEKTLGAELKIKAEALTKANEELKAENAKLAEAVADMRRTAAMESFFKAKRAEAEQNGGTYLTEVEEAVRMEAGLQKELDEEFLTKCYEKWHGVSAKVAPAPAAGLPPVPKQESVAQPEDDEAEYLTTFIEGIIG